MKYKVHVWEYLRGKGSRIIRTDEFNTEEAAKLFVNRVNECTTRYDWGYMYAEYLGVSNE